MSVAEGEHFQALCACAAGRVLTAMGQLESLCERDNVSLDALHPHSAALGIDLAALQAQQVTVRQVWSWLSMHTVGRTASRLPHIQHDLCA